MPREPEKSLSHGLGTKVLSLGLGLDKVVLRQKSYLSLDRQLFLFIIQFFFVIIPIEPIFFCWH